MAQEIWTNDDMWEMALSLDEMIAKCAKQCYGVEREDALQEGLIAAFLLIRDCEDRTKLEAHLAENLLPQMRMQTRGQKQRKKNISLDIEKLEADGGKYLPRDSESAHGVAAFEVDDLLCRALDEDKKSLAIARTLAQGGTQHDTASSAGVARSTLQKKLPSIREKLRPFLK